MDAFDEQILSVKEDVEIELIWKWKLGYSKIG